MESPSSTSDRPQRRGVTFLVIITLVVVALIWRSAWFGTTLSEEQMSRYLAGKDGEQKVQHALEQLSTWIRKDDPRAQKHLAEAVPLANHRLAEIRKTLAWVLSDVRDAGVSMPTLKTLLGDKDLAVRGQAALGLANHGDVSGRAVILELLGDVDVAAPVAGRVRQLLKTGEPVVEGMRLLRIESDGNPPFDVISPIPGKVVAVAAKQDGDVEVGAKLLTVRPGDKQIFAALYGLAIVGTRADADVVDGLRTHEGLSAVTSEQIKRTAEALRSRP